MRARFLYRLYWGKGVAYRSPFSFHRIFILKKNKNDERFFPLFRSSERCFTECEKQCEFFFIIIFHTCNVII